MISVLPDLWYLLVNSIGRAALSASGGWPGAGREWQDSLQAYVERNGKFSKFAVAYSPVAPPPVFWEYNCGSCLVFQRESLTCRWVSEPGWPQDGQIHPAAWCAIWMPREDDKPFSWVGRVPWFLREPLPAFP